MHHYNPALVICVAVVLIIGVNAFLFSLVYRKDGVSQIDQLRAMGRRAKAPWKDEDDALAQLSKDVAELQKHRPHNDDGDNPTPPKIR
jgi:hypothetical protein